MKQALLITGYKDVDSLIELVNLLGDDFNFYIHIDRKSKLELSEFQEYKNVFVSTHYRVNWGGFNHLKAILLLANEALKESDNAFFHLITGEDYPIKPRAYFKNIDITANYIEFFELPVHCWSGNGGMDRIDYFNFHDIFNARKSTGYRILDGVLNMQKKLHWKRKYPAEFRDLKLYGGSTYWSLGREVLQYVVDFTKNKPSFLKRFAHTFCAEEIYFQTIVLQSPYAKAVINDNLRYIDWQAGPQRHPMYLIEDDYEKLISSNKLFARKIDNKQSRSLRTMLANHFRNGGTVNG